MNAAAEATAIVVLLVEDQWLIRMTAAEALSEHGYVVHEAKHAAEAIDILEQHHPEIHVVFTDIMMPGTMDGLGLAHHASKHWPPISLIVVSAKPWFLHPPLPEKARFVHKPYVIGQVVQHIRELRTAA